MSFFPWILLLLFPSDQLFSIKISPNIPQLMILHNYHHCPDKTKIHLEWRISTAKEESGLVHTDWGKDICWVPLAQHEYSSPNVWLMTRSQGRTQEFCITNCSSSLLSAPRNQDRSAEIPVNLQFTCNIKTASLTKKKKIALCLWILNFCRKRTCIYEIE